MNRKSVIRKRRKEIMKLGQIKSEEALERYYCIDTIANGYYIRTLDRNRFEAMKSALACVIRVTKEMKLGEKYDR